MILRLDALRQLWTIPPPSADASDADLERCPAAERDATLLRCCDGGDCLALSDRLPQSEYRWRFASAPHPY